MTTRDMQRSIEPGSLAYGDRQGLEANLSAATAPMGAEEGGGAAPGGGNLSIPEDPLGALLSGELGGNPDSPITDGLSMGPGSSPESNDVMMGSRAERVRQLAQEASSPQIRAAARSELRRMAREAI